MFFVEQEAAVWILLILILKFIFFSSQLITALGAKEAESKYQSLLSHLSHPPAFTTVRVNTHLASVKHVKKMLFEEIQKVCAISLLQQK